MNETRNKRLDFLPRVPFRQGCIISRTKVEIKCVCSIALLCLTLCNPMGYSPPGSSVHGILQARILEQVAIASSWGSSQPRGGFHISCITAYSLLLSYQGSPNYLLLGGKAGIWDKGKQQSLQESRGRKILASKLHKCISYIKYSRFMTDSAFRSSQKLLISFKLKKESKLLG